MGSITKPLSAGEVEVLVDKAVPSDGSTLYRIDMTPSYGGGSMAGYLADFCSSDSERLVTFVFTTNCFCSVLYTRSFINEIPDHSLIKNHIDETDCKLKGIGSWYHTFSENRYRRPQYFIWKYKVRKEYESERVNLRIGN